MVKLAERFVPIMLDVGEASNDPVVEKYNAAGIPDVRLLDKAGRELDGFNKPIPAAELKARLEKALR